MSDSANHRKCDVCMEAYTWVAVPKPNAYGTFNDVEKAPCGHTNACPPCLETWIKTQLADGFVTVMCYESRCRRAISNEEIVRYVGQPAYDTLAAKRLELQQHRLRECADEFDAVEQRWLQEHSRVCPDCNVIIERSEGCNHMTCGVCRASFCWMCAVPPNVSDATNVCPLHTFKVFESTPSVIEGFRRHFDTIIANNAAWSATQRIPLDAVRKLFRSQGVYPTVEEIKNLTIRTRKEVTEAANATLTATATATATTIDGVGSTRNDSDVTPALPTLLEESSKEQLFNIVDTVGLRDDEDVHLALLVKTTTPKGNSHGTRPSDTLRAVPYACDLRLSSGTGDCVPNGGICDSDSVDGHVGETKGNATGMAVTEDEVRLWVSWEQCEDMLYLYAKNHQNQSSSQTYESDPEYAASIRLCEKLDVHGTGTISIAEILRVFDLVFGGMSFDDLTSDGTGDEFMHHAGFDDDGKPIGTVIYHPFTRVLLVGY